jgi:hypothetical protein
MSERSWEVISMDFITCLLLGHDAIPVCGNKLK